MKRLLQNSDFGKNSCFRTLIQFLKNRLLPRVCQIFQRKRVLQKPLKFELHPNLQKKMFVTDLKLCSVLLENEAHYPWLILVPRKNNVQRMMDLAFEDQVLCIQDLDIAQRVLWELFSPSQLNVAAIGNKTPQLHWHVIARYTSDPAWPGTVWDHPARLRYPDEKKNKMLALLRDKFKTI